MEDPHLRLAFTGIRYTLDGRYITVIYEQIDEVTVYPVTAFEVPESG